MTDSILNWLETRFTKHAPLEYIINEYKKEKYIFPMNITEEQFDKVIIQELEKEKIWEEAFLSGFEYCKTGIVDLDKAKLKARRLNPYNPLNQD